MRKTLITIALAGAILPPAHGQTDSGGWQKPPAFATIDIDPPKAKKPPATKDPDRIIHYYRIRSHIIGDAPTMYHDVAKRGTIRMHEKNGNLYYIIDGKTTYKDDDDLDGQIQDDNFRLIGIEVHSAAKDYIYFISDGEL